MERGRQKTTSRQASIALLFALALGLLAGCDLAPGPTPPTPLPSPAAPSPTEPPPTPTLEPRPPALKWHFQDAASVSAGAVITGSRIIFGDKDGYLYALDVATGELQWKRGLKSSVNTTPVVVGSRVYVGATSIGDQALGEMIAVDIRTGEIAWRDRTDAETITSPVVAGRQLIFGDTDGVLHFLDARRGEEEQVQVADVALSEPVLDGDTLYVSDESGSLHALDSASGKERWHFEANASPPRLSSRTGVAGPLVTAPAVANGAVYFANALGGPLYAVDAATGKERWSFEIGDVATPSPTHTPDEVNLPMITSPAAADARTVYVGVSFGLVGGPAPDRATYLYAIDAATGQQRWRKDMESEIGARPVIAGGTLYATSRGGLLYALDLLTGRTVWQFEADAPISASPMVQGGTVYFGSFGGSFYALSESDVGR